MQRVEFKCILQQKRGCGVTSDYKIINRISFLITSIDQLIVIDRN